MRSLRLKVYDRDQMELVSRLAIGSVRRQACE
jgi:hypothetical protein